MIVYILVYMYIMLILKNLLSARAIVSKTKTSTDIQQIIILLNLYNNNHVERVARFYITHTNMSQL